jgi:hypothetical protein
VDGEKKLSELRALLEETDLRIAETKKDTYEFKRDIVVGAENFRTGRVVIMVSHSLFFQLALSALCP